MEPGAVAIEQLVNLGVTTFTQLIDGKPDIQFPAINPMTAIPAGTTPAQLSNWNTGKFIRWLWHTEWGVTGSWGSRCQFRLHYDWGGKYNGVGQFLANVFLTRGDPWDPSVESQMKVSINPGAPTNVGDPTNPLACLPVVVSVHETMEPWFLTGEEAKDWTFYLYGNGTFQVQ